MAEAAAPSPAAWVERPAQPKSPAPAKLAHAEVMAAIWNASQQTGVDYKYLVAKAQVESGLNPDAKARTSSAAGLFQFIEGTWLSSLERHQALLSDKGHGPNGLLRSLSARVAVQQGPAPSRQELLDWRHDPAKASLIAAAHAVENGERLAQVLGRKANGTELYLAHFLGTGGAVRFINAWQSNPHASAAYLFPRAARANRPIFYLRSGRPRSLQGVLEHFDAKLRRAARQHGEHFDASRSRTRSGAKTVASWLTDAPQHHGRIGRSNAADFESTLCAATKAFESVTASLLCGIPHVTQARDAGEMAPADAQSGATTSHTQLHDAHALTPLRGLSKPVSRLTLTTAQSCNHIQMCYEARMDTSTITQVRNLIESGSHTKAGIARAAGLHANTLRDASEADWNPTAETLAKLQKFLDANDSTPVLVGAEEIIDEARNGRMYILVDDEDRENEGDLIIPAQMATPAAINFMATHGRGLICLALDKARVDELGLDPMSRNNQESMQTAFTVSIEAREGVTTGISAADRSRTVSVAIDASKGAKDIVTPGHVFPLMARDGGTLVRAGHTEAAVDISRLAGLNPSGVICEIMNEDGTMARLDDLIGFARKHDLKIGTIRDLIAYRMRNDHLVERVGERSFESDYGGQWRMITYRNTVSDSEAYVLQKGHITPGEPTLARVHPISVFDDVLGAPGPRKRTLQRAMGAIGEKGAGVIVILTQRVGTSGEWTADEEHRNIGIGSQILADLGVQEMTLLTNSRPDLVALEGYGITLAGHRPIPD